MSLTTLPDEVTKADTVDEAAARLGSLLELPGPAPLPATRRALAEPLFARALLASRKLPALRDQLLTVAQAVRITDTSPAPHQLAAKAAKSVLKWGMDGLRPAEPWVIERRLAACAACAHQVPAPDTLVYRGAQVVVGKDAKICALCHCLTNTKAAISTERCPDRHPDDPSRSRWSEPWLPPEDHPQGPW